MADDDKMDQILAVLRHIDERVDRVIEVLDRQGNLIATQGELLEQIVSVQRREGADIRVVLARLEAMGLRIEDIENRLDTGR